MIRSGHDWQAEIRVGDVTGPGNVGYWYYSKGLPLTVGGPGNILAGLTVGWKLPDNGLYPSAPEPTTMQFSLLVEDQADLGPLDIGAVVRADFYLGVDDGDPVAPVDLPSVTFAGRVAQMDGRPRRVNGVDGFQVDIVAVDYTADLGEREVAGVIPFQGIGVRTMVEELFRLADLPFPDWNGGGWGCAQLVPGDAGTGIIPPGALGETVDTILSSYADGGDIPTNTESNKWTHDWYPLQGWRRGYLMPTYDLYGDLEGYRLEWFGQRNILGGDSTADTFPLELYYATGAVQKFRLRLAAPVGGSSLNCRQVLPAGYVDYGVNYKRTKNSTPTTVIVASNVPDDVTSPDPWRQVQASTTEPRPQVSTRVADFKGYMKFNAEFSAEMLTPDPAPYKDLADGFTYYADQDPQWPLVPSWFPTPEVLWFGHSLPILIVDIPPTQSPGDDRGWYAGTLSAASFTIDVGGTFRFDFNLRPGAPLPGGFYAANPWNYMPANQLSAPWAPGGVAWTPANTDPTLTVQDFRLARRHM